MDIPYTSHPREDTGLYNAKVGIWLFLASEVMLFGALFSAYILLRTGAAPGTWPHGLLNVPLGTINTLVLICSSVTVVMAWSKLKMNQFDQYKIYQTITVVCALIFIGIKSFEYKDKSFWGPGTDHGFIAEEAHNLGLTDFVTYKVVNGETVPDAFKYTSFVSSLQQVNQDQQAEIDDLRARLEAAGL